VKRSLLSLVSFILSIMLLTGVLLIGCATGNTAEEAVEQVAEEAGEEAVEQVAEGDGITINIIAMQSDDQKAAMETLPKFEEETGINVEVSYFTWDNMMATEKMDFATHAGAYDLVCGTDYPLSGYVAAGWVEPIDQFINDTSLPDPQIDDIFDSLVYAAMERDGKIYGLPITMYANMFGYRKDLYIENGIVDDEGNPKVPETYEEMRQNAIKLTQDTDGDGQIDQYGMALFSVKGDPLTYDLGPYLWAYGASFVDMDTMRAGFTTPEGKEALRLYADYILTDKVTPPGVLSFAHAEFIDAMRTGLTAQGIFFQEAVGNPMEDPEYSQVIGKIGYAVNPGVELPDGSIRRFSNIGAFGLYLNKDSKHKKEAYLVMNYLSSAEQSKERILNGGKPFRISDFEIPEVMEKYPFYEYVKESLEVGRSMPQLPEWETIVQIFIENYHNILSGSQDFDDGIDKAAEDINAILEEAYPE